MNQNKDRLDNCDGMHSFEPIMEKDGKSSAIYKCSKCGGLVPSIVGLRYSLTGVLEFNNNA